MILLRDGGSIAAIDVHTGVRTFMPFDVTSDDRRALGSLRDQDLSLDRDAARAAHLYLGATRAGPSREGVLLMWLAVDALVGTRKTQKQAVASRLAEIGFDLDWLTLPLGRLIGLRGNIAHGRVDSGELLRLGYYDTEAIARGLIRADAGISSGWPAMPSATAFPPPLGRQISDAQGNWEAVWHGDGLPLVDADPPPTGLPRLDAAFGGHSAWLEVGGSEDDVLLRRLRFWTMAAIQASGLHVDRLRVRMDHDEALPAGVDMATNPAEILVSPTLAQPDTDFQEARLAYLLCRAVGECHVMRLGINSEGFGAFLIELAGAWAGYREWVLGNEMPAEALYRGPLMNASLQDLGAYVGIALAGDAERQEAITSWLQEENVDSAVRTMVAQIMGHFGEADDFPELFALIEDLTEELR